MANPTAILEASGLRLDPVVQADGTVRTKAGGDTYAVAGFDDAAPQLVQEMKSAAATVSRVASSASSVSLLAANAARKGVTIYNESTQILYVHLAASAATSTNYWYPMATNSYVVLPFNYTGEIRGIWVSANGFAMVTEFA